MAPGDLRILNVIRPLVGILLTINLLGLWPDRYLFFGADGYLPDDIVEMYTTQSWSIKSFVPRSELGINTYFLVHFAALATLILGIYPRCSALVVFILFSGFVNSNTLIFDGEDTMFRLFAFFLIFAPGPKQLRDAGLPGQPGANPYPVWPLRLFQFQMGLMFFACALQKMRGDFWADGTAVYYVFRLYDFYRIPAPALFTENMMIIKLMTWGVIVFELAAPILIWFKETRVPVLLLLIGFHLGVELTMNLFLFHWLMITGWLCFATWDDGVRILSWFRRKDSAASEYPVPQAGVS
jgi:hypothetical protein